MATSDAMTDCYGDRDDFTIKAVVDTDTEPECGDCEEVEDDE